MMKTLVKNQPWVMFLVLGLIAQQGNMLSYKIGGEQAVPFVFLAYSFLFQMVLNLGFTLFFKNRGFPIVLDKTLLRNIAIITLGYMLNETLFVSIYRAGAPYALATAIFSVSSLVLLTCAGIILFKEKLNRKQIAGIFVALAAIIMIKVG